MAEGIARGWLSHHLVDGVRVDSAGTSAAHAGERADPRTREVLRRHGLPEPSRSRVVVPQDFLDFDWILAADSSNLHHLERSRPPDATARLALMLGPTSGGGVPDPYYGGADGFDVVYEMLDEAVEKWMPIVVDGSAG